MLTFSCVPLAFCKHVSCLRVGRKTVIYVLLRSIIAIRVAEIGNRAFQTLAGFCCEIFKIYHIFFKGASRYGAFLIEGF